MAVTDELLDNNAAYAVHFSKAGISASPARKVAVLTCMDARLDPARALGLDEGDAHVIRNAGGIATDDAIRSLVISQRLLGTEEIVLIHHTDCGMEKFSGEALKDELERETGVRPGFSFESFENAEAELRRSATRIESSPFLPHKVVRGFMYEVTSGRLREVALD